MWAANEEAPELLAGQHQGGDVACNLAEPPEWITEICARHTQAQSRAWRATCVRTHAPVRLSRILGHRDPGMGQALLALGSKACTGCTMNLGVAGGSAFARCLAGFCLQTQCGLKVRTEEPRSAGL